MICHVLKGTSMLLLRYTAIWNILNYPEGLGASASLSLKFLPLQLATLLALTRPSHSADLVALQIIRDIAQKVWCSCQQP